MANQAMRALGSNAVFQRNKKSRRKKIKADGRDYHFTIHGVWRPTKGEGGLRSDVLRNSDILLVPRREILTERTMKNNPNVDLWDHPESMKILKDHLKRGNVMVVHEDMSDKELFREIEKRSK
jgi:hypothetical protein